MSTNDLIIVTARIHMKKTDEGGRKFGFASGYRPNHVFEIPENGDTLTTYAGDIQFDDQLLVEPGETKVVTVRFLNMSTIAQYMKIGQKWYINEANRTLGFGEILSLI
nr:hypothetical protein [Paraflavitalea sp. H1-2-19X]